MKEAAEEKREDSNGVETEAVAEAALASLNLEERTEKKTEEDEETSKLSEAAAASVKVEPAAESLPTREESSAAVTSEEVKKEEEKKDGKKKKNRCFVCKKKLGLTGFSCRCDGLFCAVHR